MKKRADAFKKTRTHHLLEAAEDYTELVAELIEKNGEARIRDIAHQLGISHVTALRTVGRLVRDGFLKTAPRAPITLTPKGAKIAKESKERHEILLDFLIKIGVPRETALIDVEGIEHHISPVTLRAVQRFLRK